MIKLFYNRNTNANSFCLNIRPFKNKKNCELNIFFK